MTSKYNLLTGPIAHSLLSSALPFCMSAVKMFSLFVVGESREFECLAVLCRQQWHEFYTKVPKEYKPLMKLSQYVH